MSFILCTIVGVVLLVEGLTIPAHLRAVDTDVLEHAGQGTPGLVSRGLELASQNQLGAAQLFSQAAKQQRLPGREKLEFAVDELSRQHPAWVVWGGPEPQFESIFQKESGLRNPGSDPFTEYVIRLENRERVLGLLSASRRPAVQQLLQSTNTDEHRRFSTIEFFRGASLRRRAVDLRIVDGGWKPERGSKQ